MVSRVLPRLRSAFQPAPSGGPNVRAELLFKREYLRKMDIFRDLSPDEMEGLDHITRMTTVSKGRVIYRQEDTAEGLFLLKRGRVRLSRYTSNGKRLDLGILEPGTFFGEMPLLGERMRNAQAEAIDDCTLCVMSQTDIERLVLKKPQVALRMLQVIGRRLAEAEARLEDLAYRSVPARLASVLLRLSAEQGNAIDGVTHQELGDMVGAYRETVSKILADFESKGHIRAARRRIEVLDRPGLEDLLANN